MDIKADDEIAFVIPGEEGEYRGVVVKTPDSEGFSDIEVYVPGFPYGDTVAVDAKQITARVLYSNAGLSSFEDALKVEYWDEDARRILVGWVYDIDTANREIVIMARGRTFSRFPEELRIIPPPRLCENGTGRNGKERSDEPSDQR